MTDIEPLPVDPATGEPELDVSLWCVSHRPALVEEARASVAPLPLHHFDGTGAPSFSWLVNQVAFRSPTEIVIVMSDKARPTVTHVLAMLGKLDEGYAVVGLHRFGFFGFHKEVFRRIGPMDETLLGREDSDYQCRLKEANLAYYESEEVPLLQMPSSWPPHIQTGKWFCEVGQPVKRLRPEQAHPYNFGEPTERAFLPWSQTVMLPPSHWFVRAEIS